MEFDEIEEAIVKLVSFIPLSSSGNSTGKVHPGERHLALELELVDEQAGLAGPVVMDARWFHNSLSLLKRMHFDARLTDLRSRPCNPTRLFTESLI
jgi:hypothetical protein